MGGESLRLPSLVAGHKYSLCSNTSGTCRSVPCPLPPAPAPSSHSPYSGHAAVVCAIALEDSSILQEHSTGLEDESSKQLRVDVVPGAVEPPGRDKRDEWRGLTAKRPSQGLEQAWHGWEARQKVSQCRVAKATSNKMKANELDRK